MRSATLIFAYLLLKMSCIGAAAQTPTIVNGRCTEMSHIAEGDQTEDLTKRGSRFFCNSVVIMNPRNDSRRMLLTFLEKESNTSSPIGYAGTVTEDGMVDVQRVYIRSGVSLEASGGTCKFFRKDGEIESIFCGAKVDQGDRRTVLVVGFEVNREARTSGTESRPAFMEAGVVNCASPGTSVEFYLDGQGGAKLVQVKSNYSGFINAAKVKNWSATTISLKDKPRLLVLDNGKKSRIMADPKSGKAMGFMADGGVSDMLCQVLVKPQ